MQTPERSTQLLFRQLKDIQVQADRIMQGEHSAENIEQFARYSIELKKFALDRFKGTPAEQKLHELPEIKFQRNAIGLGDMLTFSWISIHSKERVARERSLQEIREARNKYASLEFTIRDMLG
jgi:hypothetical protein